MSVVKNKIVHGASPLNNLIAALTEGARKFASPQVRKMLVDYGDWNVVGVYVGRHPISKVLRQVVNLITRGNLEKNMKRLNYDAVYHLYSLIKIEKDGATIILKAHKEEVVQLEQVSASLYKDLKRPEQDGFTVTPKPCSLSDWIQKTEKSLG